MPNYTTFPVAKVDAEGNAEFFGYADAQQVHRSKGKLVPYDAELAAAAKAKKDAEKKDAAEKAEAEASAQAAEKGADPAAVRKEPGAKK